MNPDESLNQEPMEESIPPSDSSDPGYTPQPLPEVLAGRSPQSTDAESHTGDFHTGVSDPWAVEPPATEPEDQAIAPISLDVESMGEDDLDDSIDTLVAEGLEIIDEELADDETLEAGDLDAEGFDAEDLADRVSQLRQQEQALRQQVASLQQQLSEAQMAMGNLVKEGLSELEHRKQTLQISVEQLERRQDRIRAEMRKTFAGTSQELAIRVQGFKDYLVGSLQDLVAAADELKLAAPAAAEPSRRPQREPEEPAAIKTQFAEQNFQDASRMIRKLLDQYRTAPDYYGPPWQLRRTFEPIHAERVSNWFFEQGGRGAVRSMGSRLQNILIAAAVVSILHRMYGDRIRTLVLSDSPERLGEWRRGLQDCLGIGRMDFGTDQGVTLFDAPEPMAQRADRLVKQKFLPIILIDESEGMVDLSLLQFPLWLAFASDPMRPPASLY